MSLLAYKIYATCVTHFYGKMITSKPISHTQSRLYYEIAQHLGFSLKRTIDYETSIQTAIRPFVSKGSTVFDIGGNIGQFALVFSEWVGREGRVLSIEPDPRTFAFLSFNKLMNEMDHLTCIHAGVGPCEGELFFKPDTTTGGRRGTFVHRSPSITSDELLNRVPIVTLDSLVDEFGKPNFIKMDVEGFESEVLKGLSKDLDDCTFLVEVRKDTKNFVYNFFLDREYKCEMVDKSIESIKSNSDIPDFANLLFSRQ